MDPTTVDEWLDLAAQHEAAAKALCRNAETAARALHHVGSAVECALKARIMRHERLNSWPSRPEYRTHNLVELLARGGLSVDPIDLIAPRWAVVIQWSRYQDYSPRRMPVAVANSYVDAAFGTEGVVAWIKNQL